MLPERLSTDLTSLNEGEDRLAVVVDMTTEANGSVTASEVYAARVRNQAKLAYNAVAAWLDGAGPAPAPLASVAGLADQIRMQDRVAQAMKATRHQRGALTLESIEAKAVFEGMQLSSSDGHTTVISGHVPDQAALHGLLQRCRDLGLTLVSVTRLESR